MPQRPPAPHPPPPKLDADVFEWIGYVVLPISFWIGLFLGLR